MPVPLQVLSALIIPARMGRASVRCGRRSPSCSNHCRLVHLLWWRSGRDRHGLNLLGPGLSYLIMYTIWGSRGTSPWLPGFSAVDIPLLQDIPVLGPLLSGHNPCIYLCIALTVLMHYVIYHTRYGLRVRAAGENPMALATVGVNVYRLRTSAVLWGGLMAGLAVPRLVWVP